MGGILELPKALIDARRPIEMTPEMRFVELYTYSSYICFRTETCFLILGFKWNVCVCVCVLGVSSILTKSIIQHNVYIDIRIEITHNISIISPLLHGSFFY